MSGKVEVLTEHAQTDRATARAALDVGGLAAVVARLGHRHVRQHQAALVHNDTAFPPARLQPIALCEKTVSQSYPRGAQLITSCTRGRCVRVTPRTAADPQLYERTVCQSYSRRQQLITSCTRGRCVRVTSGEGDSR